MSRIKVLLQSHHHKTTPFQYAAAGVSLLFPNTIQFFKIPKKHYGFVEENAVEIVAHETIHITLDNMNEHSASIDFDKFFGSAGTISDFLETGKLRKVN